MPCFFCDSIYHPSHLCDICVTDEERAEFAKSKNCCVDCLSDEAKHMKKVGFRPVLLYKPRCIEYAKCYECFSKDDHLAFYCPERFTAPSKLFVPTIDKDLLPRFLKMFDTLEQYSIGFLFPDAEKAIKFKPMKIYVDKEATPKALRDPPTIIIAMKEFTFRDIKISNTKIFDAITSKIFFNRAKELNLYDCKMSANNFLLLLTPYLKDFRSSVAEIVPPITLAEFLQRTSNIERLDFFETNIHLKSTWPNDLLLYTTNLKYFYFYIKDFKFDVKPFFELLKPKKQEIRSKSNND